MLPASAPQTPLRLAEVVAAFSVAADIGTGIPAESMLRIAYLSLHLGEAHGVTDSELIGAYYLPMLALTGCVADSLASADMLGDETDPEMVNDWVNTDFGKPPEAMRFVFRNIGAGKAPLSRAAYIVGMMSGRNTSLSEIDRAHCEVAHRVCQRLGFSVDLQDSIWHVYERWDGKGVPNKVKGEALTLPARLLHLSMDVVHAYITAGPDAAVAMARHKNGTKYDPSLVETFLRHSTSLLSILETEPLWDAVIDAEPGPRPIISESQLDTAVRAVADFADLKVPFMSGHSPAVADLASAAARRCKLPEADITSIRRAALVHDVGRVGISAAIWAKNGPLSMSEWERVRLYPYYTERVLARPRPLAPLGVLASLHRERLDGSGYHKGLPAALLSASARILAAADAYRSMIEPRPYRPALSSDEAASQLRQAVRSNHLDSEAVNSVLAEAGHRAPNSRKERPGGLSDREIEVLRLLARGLPVHEISTTLVVSKKTIDNHIQHIYNKIAVSTRAAATFFAMENNLLE